MFFKKYHCFIPFLGCLLILKMEKTAENLAVHLLALGLFLSVFLVLLASYYMESLAPFFFEGLADLLFYKGGIFLIIGMHMYYFFSFLFSNTFDRIFLMPFALKISKWILS